MASCSDDKSIKLYRIKGNKYEVLQTLNQAQAVYKIKELKNKTLASCAFSMYPRMSIITFYIKENLIYKKDYQISETDSCSQIIQTKDNEICYEDNPEDDEICFYDFTKKKEKLGEII